MGRCHVLASSLEDLAEEVPALVNKTTERLRRVARELSVVGSLLGLSSLLACKPNEACPAGKWGGRGAV